MIFLNGLFGYLCLLIIMKWATGSTADLYHTLIYMFLSVRPPALVRPALAPLGNCLDASRPAGHARCTRHVLAQQGACRAQVATAAQARGCLARVTSRAPPRPSP